MTTSVSRPGRRAVRAAAARRLADEGKLHWQIADKLGISRSYTSSLLTDPKGENERRRKARYRGVCSECDGPTTGGNGPGLAPTICNACARRLRSEGRRWTRAAIRTAFQAFAAEWGRAPATSDLIGRAPSHRGKYSAIRLAEIESMRAWERLPTPWIVRREFGSWAAAVADAGLVAVKVGGLSHRDPHHQAQDAIVELLAENGPMTRGEIAERRGVSVRVSNRSVKALIAAGVIVVESVRRSQGYARRGVIPGVVKLAE